MYLLLFLHQRRPGCNCLNGLEIQVHCYTICFSMIHKLLSMYLHANEMTMIDDDNQIDCDDLINCDDDEVGYDVT